MAPGRFKKTRGFSLEKVGSILNGIVNAAPVGLLGEQIYIKSACLSGKAGLKLFSFVNALCARKTILISSCTPLCFIRNLLLLSYNFVFYFTFPVRISFPFGRNVYSR